MVNECLMHLRKKGGLKIVDEGHATEISSDDGLLARMSAQSLFKLIMELPIGYRTVFNMYAIEGYNHKEIADALGIAEGTSKSQMNKARTMLQQKIVAADLK
jgi:RNA polymerase sigma-70 factor (ECF subfamily)